jgi:hypothetical protein
MNDIASNRKTAGFFASGVVDCGEDLVGEAIV